jgi:enoyl-CoA hydratase/carnithine racemase
MSRDKILSEKFDGIALLTFNNPERYNAVSLDMWDSVEAYMEDYIADDGVRVIVITGAGGKAFVSGADISKFEDERSDSGTITHYNNRVRAAYDAIHLLPKPTIAMIDGFCLGGGLALAVSCDLRFCSEKSKFGLPAAKLGLGYPFEGLKRLVDTIGPGAARDITFSARRIDADEALRIGLVQKVLPEEELRDFVVDYAKTVAANAPLTVKSMKFIINETLKDPDQRDLKACRDLEAAAFDSRDYIEGRRAFMEKRPPRFEGK